MGSDYAPHTKWQQWGSTRDARGPPGGNLCTWHARRGASSSPDGKSRRIESPATLPKATQMARACALPATDAQCIGCEMGGMAATACRSIYGACRARMQGSSGRRCEWVREEKPGRNAWIGRVADPSIPRAWGSTRGTHRRKIASILSTDSRLYLGLISPLQSRWSYLRRRRPRVSDRARLKIFAGEDHAKIETPPRRTATTSR